MIYECQIAYHESNSWKFVILDTRFCDLGVIEVWRVVLCEDFALSHSDFLPSYTLYARLDEDFKRDDDCKYRGYLSMCVYVLMYLLKDGESLWMEEEVKINWGRNQMVCTRQRQDTCRQIWKRRPRNNASEMFVVASPRLDAFVKQHIPTVTPFWTILPGFYQFLWLHFTRYLRDNTPLWNSICANGAKTPLTNTSGKRPYSLQTSSSL
jgi:hypothetical protein